MSKITLNGFVLLFLLLLGNSSGNFAAGSATATALRAQFEQTTPQSQPARPSLDQGGTGTLQKMIGFRRRSQLFLLCSGF
jgi:1,4-dihydroxy-2-naphthoyl-CoA synthase